MIRVLTVNVRNDLCDMQSLRGVLSDLDPDLALFQELGPRGGGVISEHFPHGELRPSLDYLGLGTAARFPIEVRSIPLGYRPALRARLDPEDRGLGKLPLEVFNVHFHSPTSIGAFPIRRRQIRDLEAHLDARSGGPIVVAGDLNASPAWPLYRRLEARLRDLPAELARRENRRAGRTWGPLAGGPLLFRIDHVLGAGVECVRSRTVRLEGSDHAGVMADLRLSRPPG